MGTSVFKTSLPSLRGVTFPPLPLPLQVPLQVPLQHWKKRGWIGKQWFRVKRHVGNNKKDYLIAALVAATGYAAFQYSDLSVGELQTKIMELPGKAYHKAQEFLTQKKPEEQAADVANIKQNIVADQEDKVEDLKIKLNTLKEEGADDSVIQKVHMKVEVAKDQLTKNKIQANEAALKVGNVALQEEFKKLKQRCTMIQNIQLFLHSQIEQGKVLGINVHTRKQAMSGMMDFVMGQDKGQEFVYAEKGGKPWEFTIWKLLKKPPKWQRSFREKTRFDYTSLLNPELLTPTFDLPALRSALQDMVSKGVMKGNVEQHIKGILTNPCDAVYKVKNLSDYRPIYPYLPEAQRRIYLNRKGFVNTVITARNFVGKLGGFAGLLVPSVVAAVGDSVVGSFSWNETN